MNLRPTETKALNRIEKAEKRQKKSPEALGGADPGIKKKSPGLVRSSHARV